MLHPSTPMRVVVIAPVGRDSELLCSLISGQGVKCTPLKSTASLAEEVRQGMDTLFITEEVLRDPEGVRLIASELGREPEWSDLPVIALVDKGAVESLTRRHAGLFDKLNLTILERPVRAEVVFRALSSALRARARQYQVQDFLEEKLRTQENLWRTQKLESIGVLAGGIAHDFNNLLTGILGNASLLQSKLDGDPDLTALVNQVTGAAERAADLTRQLLAYSGRGKFVTGPVDIASLIRTTVPLIRTSVSSRVDLRFEIDKDLPPVIGDRTQLEQVVMNLIINAGEAIPDDGSGWVKVSVVSTQVDPNRVENDGNALPGVEYIRISVADNGVGMSPETITRLFEPFFTTKVTGRGLGLSAVQGIVRGHGGAIEVKSELGQGSCFTVLLPASRVAVAETLAPPKAAAYGSGHILLVDDEHMVLQVAHAILRHIGYDVSLAENGEEALDVLASAKGTTISLVILDWTMPVMDGAALARNMRTRYPHIPILVASGFSEFDAREAFPDHHIVGFIQKPFTVAKLSLAVQRAYEEASSRTRVK